MARLLQIFGFLSVLFRGATLTFQSLVVGGVVFLIFVLRRASAEADALKPACLYWIRRAAFALAAMQIAYVMANSLILMQSAGISLAEVSGASFVLAGALGILSAFTILALAGPRHSNGYADLLLPAAAIIASSVITSHAMARLEYRLPLVAFTALHQAATAAWLGGLPYLLIAIRRASNPDFARQLSARFSQLALLHFVRRDGGHESPSLRTSPASRRAQFSTRAARTRERHSCQPQTLRRSGNRHRRHRDPHRCFVDITSSRRRSRARPRLRDGNFRAHGPASPALRQPGHAGTSRRYIRSSEKRIRIRLALDRILRPRPSRNAPKHSGREGLVRIQSSLGRYHRSGNRTSGARRASRESFLGAQLAAHLSGTFRLPLLEK